MDNKTFFERTGAVLIVICIIALLGAFFFSCVLYVKNDVQDVNVQIVMPVDTTGVISPETLKQVEDLKGELVRHEQLLEDRYKHVLEQKENINDLLTIGGMFLTIVLALFGFFGYKSLNAIEENVKEQAKITASNTAQSSFNEKFDEYKREAKNELEEHLKAQVKEQAGKQYAEDKSALNQSVNDKVKNAVKKYGEQIDEQKNSIDNISQSMNNLDEKYSKLNDRLLKIEDGMTAKLKPRRTLANAGRIGFVGVAEESKKTNPDSK